MPGKVGFKEVREGLSSEVESIVDRELPPNVVVGARPDAVSNTRLTAPSARSFGDPLQLMQGRKVVLHFDSWSDPMVHLRRSSMR